MKKLFYLCLLLLLVSLFVGATAEVGVLDPEGLQLDGFRLLSDTGMRYELNEKAPNAVYLTLYPFYSDGDIANNINAVWNGGPFEITAEMVNEARDALQQQFISSYASIGFQVEDSKMGEAKPVSFAGALSVVLDSEWTLNYSSGLQHHFLQRQFYVPSKGFTFTVTGLTEESLEAATQIILNSIIWDEPISSAS